MATPTAKALTALALLAAGACSQAPDSAQATKPNILLIMTDDQGWGQVGFHGNPYLKTPTLDRLAAESTEFTQFYVDAKCAPTRAALLTGRHGYRSGVIDTYLGRTLLPPEVETLAELLAPAGYATGIFGKWHLGDNYPLRSIDQGFQESLVHRGGGLSQPAGPPGNLYWDPVLEHNGQSEKYEGYCTDIFTNALIAFIEQNKDQPFFGYLPTNVPHGPFNVDEKYIAPYLEMGLPDRTARVYGMITEFDENLDRLLKKLDELHLAENTIVIFLTDNGPTQTTFTAGLRDQKGSAYDGGTRVPFLIRWPGHFAAGRKIDRIAAHIDIVPTLLEAAGAAAKGPAFDGVSLMPLLSGKIQPEDWPDRTIYLQNHRGDTPELYRNASARNQRWKIVQPLGKQTEPMPQGAKFELYDMTVDPGEATNLARQHPDIVDEMRQGYEAWFRDVSATRGYHPVPIHLGAPQEPLSTLSRYDWRGEVDDRAGDDALGYWPVVIEAPGAYNFKLRFAAPLPSPGEAKLKIGEVEAKQKVPAGAGSCEFQAISLPAGPANLEALIEYGGQTRGASFIDIHR